jgi:5'-nucleotidase
MRALLCNDDGVDASGLLLLAEAARAVASDVWIVAPERKWTAASHQLTFDRDLMLNRLGERTYSCSGAPADCVVAAMSILFAQRERPELVLSGINDKRNVGEDLAYSGTLAIAREAVFWGVPAIAFSRDAWPADAAADLAGLGALVRMLWESRTQWAAAGHWLSVNLPAVLPAPVLQPRIAGDKIGGHCDVIATTPERITYRIRRGRPGSRAPDDENAAIQAGCVSVVRHFWAAQAPLPDAVVVAWSTGLG